MALVAVETEFRVNSSTPQNQLSSADSVALKTDGSFLATYYGAGMQDHAGIYLQRYSAVNVASGATLVNTTIAGTQADAAVATNASGAFVVAWSGNGVGDANGVFFQQYRANGAKFGSEQRANVTLDQTQAFPSVAVATNGNFVVAWAGNGINDASGILYRVYKANGTPLTGELRANVTSTGTQTRPSIAMRPDGGFQVIWQGTGTGDSAGIFRRSFSAAGKALTSEVRINKTTTGTQTAPFVSASSTGSFLVGWQVTTAGQTQTYVRTFNSAGTAVQSNDIAVPRIANESATNGSAAFATDGTFIVSWQSTISPAATSDLVLQSFKADGTLGGSRQTVNTTLAGAQQTPSLRARSTGDVVVAWSGNGIGDAQGVFARRFTPDTAPPVITAALANDTGSSASDRITNDASLAGTVSDDHGVAQFLVAVDSNSASQFANLTAAVQPNGTFRLSRAQLESVLGTTLADGAHTVYLKAMDVAGNTSTVLSQTFTLDTQAPAELTATLAVASDTAPLGDLHTILSSISIVGQTEAGATIKRDSLPATTTASNTGGYSLSDVPLVLGMNTFTIQASDAAGNSRLTNVTINRDAPPAGTLVVEEGTRFVTEVNSLVDLGQVTGTRKITFGLAGAFDATDGTAASHDQLLVYLVQPNNRQATLLDRGTLGTTLFAWDGTTAEFPPEVVQFDGSTVTIDVTSLGSLTQGKLIFSVGWGRRRQQFVRYD